MEAKDSQLSENAGAEESCVEEIKKLRKKIRKLIRKRTEEIDQIKRESVRKYFRYQQKAQLVIDGTEQSSLNFLTIDGQMVIQNDEKPVQKTQPSNNQTTTVQNEGISQYWSKVLQAEYSEQLNILDKQLLPYLQEISINSYNKYKISLNFRFKEGHPIVEKGVYCRTLLKDEDGMAVEYEGNSVPGYDSMMTSFMKIVLISETNVEYMDCLGELFELLCIQLIPASLTYYLKTRLKEGLQIN